MSGAKEAEFREDRMASNQDKHSVSRRTALTGAAVLASGALAAQTARAEAPATPASASLEAADFWAEKTRAGKTIRLALYRKRLAGSFGRPVLFLVHGSSVSAKPSYDLSVPGHGDYSTMDAFARAGFDVWTMDHENYGRSDRTDSNSDIASGVEDLKAAMPVITKETGQTRIHMLGQSSGALRAGAFAAAQPESVGRLVLEAMTYTGKGSPTLAKRGEQLEFYRTHNVRPRGRDMLASILTRDKPGTSDPAVGEALADAEMVYGNQIPTGTYLDMTANLPIVDPTKIQSPVLLIRGEHDGIATIDDLIDFFKLLPSGDRQFVIVPGAAHAIGFSLNRAEYWHAIEAFLTMPKRLDT